MKVRVRFAPSPTGLLHVGNVRTALFNWLFARKNQGSFILRIEDTDMDRSKKDFEDQLLSDLRWLGLDWDEGIESGGAYGPYRQTDRFSLYREKVNELLEENKAYYCFCGPEELEQQRENQRESGQSIKYTGKCRNIDPGEAKARVTSGESATIRLRVRKGRVGFKDLVFGPIEIDTENIGDFILLRSDGSAQYNLAVVVDDALMKITHVIRGEGHISNTHRQILIYESLGYQTPEFAHLSTILGPDGSKLSKRHGATSINEFRNQGYLPEALNNYLALLGWTPPEGGSEILHRDELIAGFELSSVNVSPATFDVEKLNWVNRNHLKDLKDGQLLEFALPFLINLGLVPPNPPEEIKTWATELTLALLKYLNKMQDLEQEVRLLIDFEPEKHIMEPEVLEVLSISEARQVIRVFNQFVQNYAEGPFDFEAYKYCVLQTQSATGQKGKNLFRPVRIAITARASGPELDKVVPLLDQGSTLPLPRKIMGIKERVKAVCRIVEEIDFNKNND